ncbi:phosphotransferase [Modestobacter sp. I12A-02628]|uniref:Phosphotransferase n=1 Tax=Goekera deserti TaxID=2497753 RepID=A0A7K3WEM8_9ACTN|nr:phosphotransferase [Goekera deserti]MPQ98116.1 phosphotransferase [Goekera deserti]NDI48764.1 phosphotransferase [Goekera deserti]NEL54857.1 phosphotransferase [Goekera deserti]
MTPTPAPSPAWTPERVVDVDRAAALVAAAFPGLAGRPVEPFGEGWDNTVHLVGGEWAFRFPRRASALPGFRRELEVLPRLAPLLPLPVPVPDLVAVDDDPVSPWPFTGSRLLPGSELAELRLPEADRTEAAAALGAFLRALHAPATRDAVDVALPVDPVQRGWPAVRPERARALLDRLTDDGTWPGDPTVHALLTEAGRLDAPAGEPVLAHGDLHVRHVLLDGAGSLTGVIDWGDVCLADPAVDLSVAYAAFTGRARAALLDSYGPMDAERELRARALAVRLSALLADHAAAAGRETLLAEALAGLRRAVDPT